jgi:Winged helix DNA-binding domain
MTLRDIAHYRLVNQQIAYPKYKTPGELVALLGAMQAQDYLGSLWAIGLRLPGATAANIEQAIAGRTIVRTWPLRGTLHFVAAADVRWMLELLAPRILTGSANRQRQLELDDATIERSKKLFINALQGGMQLTRDAMYGLLEAARISTAGQRGLHILWSLAQHGIICFGAHQGKQPTFALLDEWAPNAKKLERDEALATLARRYFIGHGPATLQDFAWWSGLKVTDAKAGLDLAAPHLVRETIGDRIYWMADAPQVSPNSSAYLLPGFDEYILGYTDRSAALDPRHALKVVTGNNGRFMPTIIMKGRVAGIWNRTLGKKAVFLSPTPFASLTKVEKRAFAAAAQRYGQFLGMSVEM